MAEGISRAGSQVVVIPEDRWQGTIDADVAVFYGLEGNTPLIFETYASNVRPDNHALYIDLGYWGRREGGRWTGYHKLVVDHRHPNAYLMWRPMPSDRIDRFHVEPQPRREGGHHVLLCGMSDKGARACGYEPEEWERRMIESLRAVTDRPIVYRAKPSWKAAQPIEGTRFSDHTRKFEQELERAHCVVTRHSNCALEAMLAGVPAWASDGVAALVRTWELGMIEQATLPSADVLRQLIANVAYTQWSIAEMREGAPWRHLTAQGLV